MNDTTYADHLRAATAALTEASDRISAAWVAAEKDHPPELDFARVLTKEARSNLDTARRAAVRTDPVGDSPGPETKAPRAEQPAGAQATHGRKP